MNFVVSFICQIRVVGAYTGNIIYVCVHLLFDVYL